MTIDKIQFISNAGNGYTHLESIKVALDLGCKWIQLRIKHEDEQQILGQALQARQLCQSYDAKLIINDFSKIARAVNADGLHLGLNDMAISEARKVLDSNRIIGGTANTIEDVKKQVSEGADYVGLGPYRFTKTKNNLSPILGLDGYSKIIKQLRKEGFTIPIIAIGGIQFEDIEAILQTGIHGVAMSNAILQTPSQSITHQIQKLLC